MKGRSNSPCLRARMRTVVRLFSSVVWSLPKAEVEALFSSKRHGRVAGASLRVAGALWWQFIASRALGGSIHQTAILALSPLKIRPLILLPPLVLY